MKIWFPAVYLGLGLSAAAQPAPVEHVIHTFGNFPNGASPYGPLARDTSGNLYGTAYQGGAAGLGLLFKLGAAGYQVLYSFKGGSDGANPYAGVTLDPAGNVYGTTLHGGAAGLGVVYKIDSSGQESVLYAFKGLADGAWPYSGVTLDAAGNLYGTTYSGGTGWGVVYELSPSGQETVLHSFTGKDDGANPYAGLAADAVGNLYGTTYGGGSRSSGVIYKIDTTGHELVLHTFGGRPGQGGGPYAGVTLDQAGNLYGTACSDDGLIYKLDTAGQFTVLFQFYNRTPSYPEGELTLDSSGNLYGTALKGGKQNAGAVFELDTAGKLTILYSFPGGGLGEPFPYARDPGVIFDSAGNLYGVTAYADLAGMVFELDASRQETSLYEFAPAAGGTDPATNLVRDDAGNLYGANEFGAAANAGVVFRVDPSGSETVLYRFTGGADGASPIGGIRRDSAGNLYGTTFYGGVAGGAAGFGVVYKLDLSGHESVLYRFTGGTDGGNPKGGVASDQAGNLYGTTLLGGAYGEGVVFKVAPSGQETILHTFTGGLDGGGPESGVVLDSAGNIYGTTFSGGAAGAGVVYKIDTGGQETEIYSFAGSGSAGNPYASVILDSAGNIFGTAVNGGVTSTGGEGAGVVFEIDAAGNYSTLYTFTGGADGGAPFASVVRDSAGNLYGTTSSGAAVVYELSPAGEYAVLHSFTGGPSGDGATSLTLDAAGNLFGTATGGSAEGGLLFELRLR